MTPHSERGLMKGQWRPISEAPRDGTRIIVYRPNAYKISHGYIDEIGEDYFKGKHWMKSNFVNQPTHFMPLPQPPTDLKE